MVKVNNWRKKVKWALLHIHKDIPIDIENIITRFAKQKRHAFIVDICIIKMVD